MPESVIQVENLIKRYGDVEAVRGVSFSVEEGEVFGLLGPTAPAKPPPSKFSKACALSTAAESRSAASIRNAMPSNSRTKSARAAIHVPARQLKTFEALQLFASFYSRAAIPKNCSSASGWKKSANTFYSKLSGGQKQRLASPWP